MRAPRISRVEQRDTHRLIASKYRDRGESVLTAIADDDAHLRDIFDLDDATNERLLAQSDLLPGIGIEELVFGVPRYRVINAAFCHAHPAGSRFNGPDRGAWYAAFDLETSYAEVAFHRTMALAEIECFVDSVTCDDYLADFTGDFHDIRGDPAFEICLDRDSYIASQDLAAEHGSAGIVYPSVRRAGGTNLVCFRPVLVANLRLSSTWRLTWSGNPTPIVEQEAAR